MGGLSYSAKSVPRSPQAAERPVFRPLVRRSVSINGTKFSALVQDGTTADGIIEKIAKENGGGVAKTFNRELNACEIVAVKIGNHFLVKGEPSKVAEADFSQFDDSECTKKAAVDLSRKSKGGIHFFLGEGGIPLAVGKEGELLFPNAEEMSLKGRAETIHISLVDYDANPITFKDLDDLYSRQGGIKLSELAMRRIGSISQEEIMGAHGGMRSEKLMLADTSVLVLDIESGDMMTVKEHVAKAEGFRAPQFNQVQIESANKLPCSGFVNVGLLLPTHLGPMLIPMDGSSVKVPYLVVKVFDGRAEDAVVISKPAEDYARPKELPAIKDPEAKVPEINPLKIAQVLQAIRCFCFEKKQEGIRPGLVLRPVRIRKLPAGQPKQCKGPGIILKKNPESLPKAPSFRPCQDIPRNVKLKKTKVQKQFAVPLNVPLTEVKPSGPKARRISAKTKTSKAEKFQPNRMKTKRQKRPPVKKAVSKAGKLRRKKARMIRIEKPKKIPKKRKTARPKAPKQLTAPKEKKRPAVRNAKKIKPKISGKKCRKKPERVLPAKKKKKSRFSKKALGLTLEARKKVSGRTRARSSR